MKYLCENYYKSMTQEQVKKKFEVKFRMDESGNMEKDVFIGDERLDYSINIADYMEAAKMGLQMKHAVQQDIAKHFTKSVSEFLGRHVTIKEIENAIKTGWI
jgi:hypothetical protein